VDALGGEITVESEVGRGSTFSVFLPVASGEPMPEAAARPEQSGRARILVVDDEPLVCKALQRILSPPHDVRVRESGREALQDLESDGGWDLVLCDLMMPDVTGMELYRRLAAQAPALARRFVFLTGGAFTDSAREFLQEVPNERVEKPFDPAALRELISTLVTRPPAGE
jgi:CheY-like chemotaxis protein